MSNLKYSLVNTKIKNFIKYVTFKKILNLFKVKISKFFKTSNVLGKPYVIMIEPTNICNLKCPLCPTGAGILKRKKGHISFDTFKKIIDEVADTAFYVRLWNWGEPLLNKDLYKMIKYIKSKKLFVRTSTNSFFLNNEIAKKLIDSKLDELIVSFDGASEETYSKYRKNSNFQKIIDSIKFLVEEKEKINSKYPIINLQFIIMKHNEHEIEKIKKIAGDLKVDKLMFKAVGIMDSSMKEDIKKYLPSEKYSKYKLEGKDVKTKLESNNWCGIVYDEIVINWDGSVVACCNDMHNTFIFGNMLKEPIHRIWNNEKYQNFRKTILKNKSSINMCENCPGSTKDALINL